MKRALLTLGLAVAWITAAGATTYEYPNIRVISNPEVVPVQGQIYTATVEIESATGGVLTAPLLTSESTRNEEQSWIPVQFDLPPTLVLQPGVPHQEPLQIECNDVTKPLFFDFTYDGVAHREVIYLLEPLNWGVRVVDPAKTALVSKAADETAARPAADIPEVAPKDRSGDTGGDDEEELAANKGYRTAFGTFGYDRWLDWGTADGVSILLYDQDQGPDDFLGSMVLGPSGQWSISFNWPYAGQPDLYVVFRLSNGDVKVQFPTGDLETTYQFSSATKMNASGQTVNFGTMEPVTFEARQATHMITQFTRMWRWLDGHGYGSIDKIEVEYPQADWPHYKPSQKEIRIPNGWAWDDGMYWHEYGHHFVYEFGDSDGTDYCNPGGRCDGIKCRHCSWCEETDIDAWNEGFASYLSDAMSRHAEATYTVWNGDPIEPYNFETSWTCSTESGGTGGYDDPSITEGALAALCRDLEEAEEDEDPRGNGIGKDTIALGAKTILDIAAIDKPITPWEFINAYVAKHGGSYMQQIWSTCYNNGYNIDIVAPSSVGGSLTSPSHALSTPSADKTIEYTWNTPSDNASGVGGYSVFISSTGFVFPDATADVGEVNGLITNPMPPGDWYFTVRAVDRAGNWSPSYAGYGPVTVRDPLPPDLTAATNGAMGTPVVPTSNEDLSLPVLNPVLLIQPDTYLHFQGTNSGEQPVIGTPAAVVYLDGNLLHYDQVSTWPSPLFPGVFQTWLNKGPYPIEPGRHTLSLRLDDDEEMAEDDEVDNNFSKQWVWGPISMWDPVVLNHAPPPPLYGGWDVVGPNTQYNCDGYRLNASGTEFAGIVLRPLDLEDDYDLRSHESTSYAYEGFELADTQELSYRSAGLLDAVFVRRPNVSSDVWDFGVLNLNGPVRLTEAQGDYELSVVESVLLPYGAQQNLSLAADQYLALFHGSDLRGTANVEVVVQSDPALGPLQVALYQGSYDHMALTDHFAYATSDENGVAALYATVPAGTHGVVVWRDPIDVLGKTAGAVDFSLRYDSESPDFAAFTPSGWSGSVVPRPAPDGTPSSVWFPTSLPGNTPSTYLNSAVQNLSPTGAPSVTDLHRLDGDHLVAAIWFQPGGQEDFLFNMSTPVEVRGGRHVLSMKIDPDEEVVEKLESNNFAGRQWVWSPLDIPVDATETRLAPPDPLGGWEDVTVGTAQFNCDGFRMPQTAVVGNQGHWMAVAAMPGASSDVDLRLHEATDTTVQGFEQVLSMSTWDVAMSDYVLANFRATPRRDLDVGAIGISGSETFDVATEWSTYLATDPVGTYGFYSLGDGEFLDLHEMYLTPGVINITLHNVSGSVDWGMTMHRAGIPYHGKTPARGDVAWTEPAGAGEFMSFDVPEEGYYCLAVWKAHAGDLTASSRYDLEFDRSPTDAGPQTPSIEVSGLTGVHPNPFNPQTTLRYQVRSTEHVSLTIYDLRGVLVRRLVDAELDPGLHQVVWNGQDDAGRSVASGVYVAQMVAGAVRSGQKLVLLK